VDETAASETLTEAETSLVTVSATLTGNEQVVVDPFGVRVHFPAGVVDPDVEMDIGIISGLEGMGAVPGVGRTVFVDIQSGSNLGGNYTLRVPFLPEDVQDIDPADLGLMLYVPEGRQAGSWTAVDSGSISLVETGPGEGYLEYGSSERYLVCCLYEGGTLRATAWGRPLLGDPPLSSRFSCAARGGVFPYTYTWKIDDVEESSGVDHRFEHVFAQGQYYVTCEVTDDFGSKVETELLNVVSGNPWVVSEVLDIQFNPNGHKVPMTLNSEGNPLFAYWKSGEMHYAAFDGSDWTDTTLPLDPASYDDLDIAVTSDNRPAISLKNLEGERLEYVEWSGSDWVNQIVDTDENPGNVNQLVFDQQDRPVIAYLDWENAITRVARYDGLNWQIDTIDPEPAGFSGKPGLAIDPTNGNPAVTSYDDADGDFVYDLKFAKFNGDSWDVELVVENVDDPGFYRVSSLTFGDGGNPLIAYKDETFKMLRMAWKEGGEWHTEDVDFGDMVGLSIAMDADNHPVISYIETEYRQLTVAWFNGVNWEITDLAFVVSPSQLFDRTYLSFSPDGIPVIGYINSRRYFNIASLRGYPGYIP
jgi:hypothetical protein